jgi:hypothetical protein
MTNLRKTTENDLFIVFFGFIGIGKQFELMLLDPEQGAQELLKVHTQTYII